MKLWLDDVRPAPGDYEYHAYSVDAAKMMIESAEELGETIEVIDCDHDLGDYAKNGGDGIKLLDWLLERNTLYPIKLHTANPVGRANMQRMIDRWWNKKENIVTKNVEISINIDIAKKALGMAGFNDTFNMSNDEVFENVLTLIECYGAKSIIEE